MSEDKTNLPVVVIEDKQYLLDYSDITGIEWREIKKITGLSSMDAIAQTSMMDFEALASSVQWWNHWLGIRRLSYGYFTLPTRQRT